MMKRASEAGRSDKVRALERGLAMLELVNDEGGVCPADAARRLQLPRPTVHRLLETLENLGYVRRNPSDKRFLVTIKARRLSGGYDTDVQLSDTVGPVLSRLLQDLVWPVNIATYRAGRMVVRETTHERSPLSVNRDMLGLEVPVLRTATGRAYLSFCSQQEREEIIQLLRMQNDPEDEPYLFPGAIEELIGTCRRQGYGARLNEALVPKTSSVSLPILVDGRARGCISIIWLTSAMPANRAIKKFVPALRDAAEVIAKQVAKRNRHYPPPMFPLGRKDKGSRSLK